MTTPWEHWLAAALLAIMITGVALRLRALAPSGAMAAIILGTIVVGTGGWWSGIVLVAFFASSSIFSRLHRHASINQARGNRRDWIQVLANGWGMLAGAVLYAITGWQPWLLFGLGAIAAATADTWSSEIGRTSYSSPRLVTTWQRVSRGTSGAVSFRGLVASVAGAAFIAVLATSGTSLNRFTLGVEAPLLIAGITLAGTVGALVDSLLGATVQEQRYCDACELHTESNPHTCGYPTRQTSGLPGLNNDVVNFVCVLTGALTGLFSGIL